jgi:hypothetical protein
MFWRWIVFVPLFLPACSNEIQKSASLPEPKTKLIYFGFDNHAEKQEDILRLANTWARDGNKVCQHWQPTLIEKEADYRVLFGTGEVTIVGRRGEVIYSGGVGPLYLPHGNPDGSGVNICKLTGE